MTSETITGITILGATGTIGNNTLEVLSRHPDRYRVIALTANSDVDRLYSLCLEHRPQYAVMADAAAAVRLEQKLGTGADIRVLSGVQGLCEVASLSEVDYVMAAIVGAAGLMPTLEAARSGKRVLLANKEALVMSGSLFMQTVEENNAVLLPIDSEHNAVLQCMPARYSTGTMPAGVRRIMLTASGGPFRNTPTEELARVTPEQACAHPNWVMGRKISVDSATMMNKGLEIIEAGWLFGLPLDKISVILHPQSIIHSMVEYDDGSVLAQMGAPDMRIPIAHALAWPERRVHSGAESLDLLAVQHLDFQEPDVVRFPCLELAREAMRSGGTAPAILNAANEIAVQSFLDGILPFSGIPDLIEEVLNTCPVNQADSLDTILEDDRKARSTAGRYMTKSPSRAVR